MEDIHSKEYAIALLNAKEDALNKLYDIADRIRRQYMGDEVFIRGIVEFSNICSNNCLYCGIRASNKKVKRYKMDINEILNIARHMEKSHQTTIVLQSGEVKEKFDEEIGEMIRKIKTETSLAVTLSVGNRPYDTYKYWKECGMDRYFLRFETADRNLFSRLHPDCSFDERIECLKNLKKLGVQTGSGFMIGLPGETIETLAENILLCRALDLDMIGIGPFIPHPDTPLGNEKSAYEDDKEMFFKAIAVLRIFNPDSHIPATTAFDAVFPGTGRNLALNRGANIFMPNNTPKKYREDYLLYPGKPGVDETPDESLDFAIKRILSLNRTIGTGPGHSIKKH